MTTLSPDIDLLAQDVRRFVFRCAADTAAVPQAPEIARALGRPEPQVRAALHQLAAGRALILAPNDGAIWAANPFCAVASGFRVEASGKRYWGICAWDALGIAAALHSDAVITAPCGDCGDALTLEIRDGALRNGGSAVIHFAIPARHWWDNIGFT
jgi:alkylmercury lyase-like protein